MVPDGWNPEHPATIVDAALSQNHVFSSDPAVQFMTDLIAPYGEVKRRWTTAALDWNSGEYVQMNQTNCPFEDLPTCAMASGSIPFVFQPRQWKGYVLADGGTVWNVNIDSAINQCIDAGYDSSDIIIDLAVCFYNNPSPQ